MVRNLLLGLVTALALTAAPLVPMKAEAANRYAVVGVENTTHVTIRMQHRWGDGQWRTDVLAPGERQWFWWTYGYADENSSPRFHVRFDSDLHPGRIFTVDYDLRKNAAPVPQWEYAHKYAFRYDGTRNYIDLFDRR